MLIDSHHRKWFVATLVLGLLASAFYWWASRNRPAGLTGGSVVGLWYGIAGSLLMVYAGLLSALRRVPSWWWIGTRKVWLRGHIWLGSLSWLLILYHSGFRWGGLLERVLWVVLTLTLLTGIYGLMLQQVLPRMLLTRIACEAPYEQIPHLCRLLKLRADALVVEMAGLAAADVPEGGDEPTAILRDDAKTRLRQFYEGEVRTFLSEHYLRKSPLANRQVSETLFVKLSSLPGLADSQAKMTELAALCDERRQLGEQERLHHMLHSWLFVHIPLSLLLLVLGVAHAVLSLYY